MALVMCPECKGKVSTVLTSCPHCGFPIYQYVPKEEIQEVPAEREVEIVVETAEETKEEPLKKKKNKFFYFLLAGIPLIAVCLCIPRFINNFHKYSLSEVEPSVVTIYMYDKSGDIIGSGSGFFAYDSNTVVTNYHVYEDTVSLAVYTEDNQMFDVKGLKAADYTRDIAILEVEGNTNKEPLKFGNDAAVTKGDKVVAIGSPEGLTNTVSDGLISNMTEDMGITVFQISVPISHGSSGGALFNKDYEVIGVTYAGLDDAQNLNFAIPISVVEEVYANKSMKTKEKEALEIDISEDDSVSTNTSEENDSKDDKDKNGIDDYIEYSLTQTNVRNRQFFMGASNVTKKKIADYYANGEYHFYKTNMFGDGTEWSKERLAHILSGLSDQEFAIAYVALTRIESIDTQMDLCIQWGIDAEKAFLLLYFLGDGNWDRAGKEVHDILYQNIVNARDDNGMIIEEHEKISALEFIGAKPKLDGNKLIGYY